MEAVGLHPIEVYIRSRHTTIADRVSCRPVYELCAEAEILLGTIQMVFWWDQNAVNVPEE